jgi:hypothetical protein
MSRAFVAATVFFLVPGLLVASPAAHGQEVNCWSREATIVGTDGDDVLVGTEGSDVIAAL